MTEIDWFVSDAETADVTGPIAGGDLIDQIRAGQIGAEDQLWCEGMAEWQPTALFAWLLEPQAPLL